MPISIKAPEAVRAAHRAGGTRFLLDPSLVLYLPLYQLDGASFMSRDAYGHLGVNYGSTWTPQGRSFDGVDDYVIVPNVVDRKSVV